jgi:signal transduction histidine kinase
MADRPGFNEYTTRMSRYLQALDPRRSLATAVAWFAVVLSLTIALALVAVSNFAVNSMLAQRDAQMMRFANQLGAMYEQAAAAEIHRRALPPSERLATVAEAARELAKPDPRARVLLLDERHRIVFSQPAGPTDTPMPMLGGSLQITRDGVRVVVMTATQDHTPALRSLGIRIAVVQPSEESGHGGNLQEKLTAISILFSIFAAMIGVTLARRLTRRLSDLTTQAQRVANHQAEGIVEPTGHDEVAVLGRAFGRLLRRLRIEHDELDRMTRELERRVQARTREVERLAEESRYAAVVRERLRLARDLHDTLAHSMMEMLVEVRTLRMLHAHHPERLAEELERAEQVAREGLKEARDAVGQMRLNKVRDLGLGAALSSAVARLAERTGLDVRYEADPRAASFADPRAEAVFRIAEEALRNIDRHAQAAHVEVSLKDADGDAIELTISDDGVGFDPDLAHPGHFGVEGIREQSQLIGAALELQGAPGRGTRLRLRLRVGPEMRIGDEASEDGHDLRSGDQTGPGPDVESVQ